MSSSTIPARQVHGEVWRRVALVADRYAQQAEPDGGFGLTQTQASSIVNTAEILTVLQVARAWGIQVDVTTVDRALLYIAENLQDHCRPRSASGGRGEKTRFPLFAIEGLGSWHDRLDEVHFKTIEWALHWLRGARRGDGLPEERRLIDASLFQTSLGVRALAPMCGLEGLSTQTKELASDLLNGLAIALARQIMPGGGWPNLVYGGRLSPAKSALAISGLDIARRSLIIPHDLSFSYRNPARPVAEALAESGNALVKSRSRWSRYIEYDPEVPGTQWSHLSYASCLEALARISLTNHRSIIDEWQNLYATWSTSHRAWLEPTDPPTSTARADYSTIRAFDAAIQDIGHTGLADIIDAASPETLKPRFDLLYTQVDQFYLRDSETGKKYSLDLSRSQLVLLRSLLPPEGSPRFLSGVRVSELVGATPGSIGTMIRRLDVRMVTTLPPDVRPKHLVQGQRGAGYRLVVGGVQKI